MLPKANLRPTYDRLKVFSILFIRYGLVSLIGHPSYRLDISISLSYDLARRTGFSVVISPCRSSTPYGY